MGRSIEPSVVYTRYDLLSLSFSPSFNAWLDNGGSIVLVVPSNLRARFNLVVPKSDVPPNVINLITRYKPTPEAAATATVHSVSPAAAATAAEKVLYRSRNSIITHLCTRACLCSSIPFVKRFSLSIRMI